MKLEERLAKLANQVSSRIQESQKPKPQSSSYDQKRIEREVEYMQRVQKVNPRMKALRDRKIKIQQRRSRP